MNRQEIKSVEWNDDHIYELEVRPNESGWYYVTFYQFKKDNENDPDYFRDWIYFDGVKWLYDNYKNNSYSCFIHKKDNSGEQIMTTQKQSECEKAFEEYYKVDGLDYLKKDKNKYILAQTRVAYKDWKAAVDWALKYAEIICNQQRIEIDKSEDTLYAKIAAYGAGICSDAITDAREAIRKANDE